ncbi:MAG: hypothetical protein K6U75_06945 [Firmicutes bacterium]|nr:hypothetical protein [Bacillota bacterium]
MKTKVDLHAVNAETQQRIRSYLSGDCTRQQIAEWAMQQVKMLPAQDLIDSEYGQLLDYVLCRLLDDDWVSDVEYHQELHELLSRLERAERDEVFLP